MIKKSKFSIVTAAVLILTMTVALMFIGGCGNGQTGQEDDSSALNQNELKTLFVYVGANLKDPISELADAYEQEKGVKIEMTFNNSGSLLAQAETAKKGDIYIPGGMPAIEQAKEKGMIDQLVEAIAYTTPVIITPKGNPAQISSVEDLAKEGVKLVIPDKDATAIGKSAYKTFDKIGKISEIEKNIVASVESPAKVLAAIEMGQGDAGIVESSNALKAEAEGKIEVIVINPKVNIIEQIPVASLVYAVDKELANDFLEYLQNNGPAVFEKHGFKTKKPE